MRTVNTLIVLALCPGYDWKGEVTDEELNKDAKHLVLGLIVTMILAILIVTAFFHLANMMSTGAELLLNMLL